jgi:hypothetical protein
LAVIRGSGEERGQLGLADSAVVALVSWLGPAELPVWGPDGGILWFARREVDSEHVLTHDGGGFELKVRFYRTAIWRVTADGDDPSPVAEFDAYTVGALQVAPDGGSLIFSRIANARRLCDQQLPGDRFDDDLLAKEAPSVAIIRLATPNGGIKTLARNARRPQLGSASGTEQG